MQKLQNRNVMLIIHSLVFTVGFFVCMDKESLMSRALLALSIKSALKKVTYVCKVKGTFYKERPQ